MSNDNLPGPGRITTTTGYNVVDLIIDLQGMEKWKRWCNFFDEIVFPSDFKNLDDATNSLSLLEGIQYQSACTIIYALNFSKHFNYRFRR